ncbi:MAG: protein kinase, partial [Actinobacteria bacterium]|nr:protein kinase [Actinomycetota bacterium]
MTGGGAWDHSTVGPYRLVSRLGEGGMGVVHLAVGPDDRAVAIKVLKAHVAADPDARLRLAREVATLRRVRHPRVAEVLDADVDGPVPYLVTRFVPGRTLDDLVRERGPMPLDRVVHTGRLLAEALRTIHAAGVV